MVTSNPLRNFIPDIERDDDNGCGVPAEPMSRVEKAILIVLSCVAAIAMCTTIAAVMIDSQRQQTVRDLQQQLDQQRQFNRIAIESLELHATRLREVEQRAGIETLDQSPPWAGWQQ